jgi:hypothetical protein
VVKLSVEMKVGGFTTVTTALYCNTQVSKIVDAASCGEKMDELRSEDVV